MSMKKFDERRALIQKKAEQELARLLAEEQKEKERRIGPLVSKYTNLFEDVLTKALEDQVDLLDNVKFKKTTTRKRMMDFIMSEVNFLIVETEGDEDLPEVNEEKSTTEQSQPGEKTVSDSSSAPKSESTEVENESLSDSSKTSFLDDSGFGSRDQFQ